MAAQGTMMIPAPTTHAHEGEADATPSTGADSERRGSGRRSRARDRLLDRGSHPTEVPAGTLMRVRDIENTLLFIDDDLRETALAMTRIEDFLTRTMQTLESPQVCREHVHALASEVGVLDHLDQLSETLESLRRRLGRLSTTMK